MRFFSILLIYLSIKCLSIGFTIILIPIYIYLIGIANIQIVCIVFFSANKTVFTGNRPGKLPFLTSDFDLVHQNT